MHAGAIKHADRNENHSSIFNILFNDSKKLKASYFILNVA